MAQTVEAGGAVDPNTAAKPAEVPALIGTRGQTVKPPSALQERVTAYEKILADAQKKLDAAQKAADEDAAKEDPSTTIDPTTNKPVPGTGKPFGTPSASLQKSVDDATKAVNDATGKLADAKVAADAETAKNASKVIPTTTSTDHKYIVSENPGGNPPFTTSINPSYIETAANKNLWTSLHVGNKIVSVNNQDGTVKLGFTDDDAANLADRNTKVAEAQVRIQDAAQKANDVATRAKTEIDAMVAAGLDAKSLRDQKDLEIRAAHAEWTRADGDLARAQQALTTFETGRHNKALETLNEQQVAQTEKWQAMQDATTRRAQDLTDLQAKATNEQSIANTKAGLINQRLSSGQGYLGNVMSTMAQLNDTVEPGSSVVGDMFQPFMNMGQQFFSQLGGLENPYDANANLTPRVPAGPQGAAIQNAANPNTPGQPADLLKNPISADGAPFATVDAVDQLRQQRQAATGLNTTGLAPVETAEESIARNANAPIKDPYAQYTI